MVVHAEGFNDGTQLTICVEQLLAIGSVGRKPRGQLPAVLHVEQHPRHEPRHLFGASLGRKAGVQRAAEMVNRGDPAFVL